MKMVLLFFTFSFAACYNSANDEAGVASIDSAAYVLRTDTGLATYYGAGLEGKLTASGDTFHIKNSIAAHPSLPIGSIVKVTNLFNSNSVKVTIADRGPSKKLQKRGIVIDLSESAAEKLDMMDEGIVKVKVEVLKWGDESVN